MDKSIFDLQGTKIRIIIIHSKSGIVKNGWRIEITKMEGPPGYVESVGSNPSGALTKTYLELRYIPVEEFLEMLPTGKLEGKKIGLTYSQIAVIEIQVAHEGAITASRPVQGRPSATRQVDIRGTYPKISNKIPV